MTGYIPPDPMKILVPIPRQLAEASKARANEMGMSRAELIRMLLTDYLESETE